MVLAAIGIGGALSAGSSIFGASEQAGAAGQASAAQEAAIQQAIGAEEGFFNTGKNELQPFQTQGLAAGGQLSALLGLNGGGAAGAEATLKNLPGYQFTLAQGQQAQSAGITARGLGLSGAQLRGASDYAQGAAQQNYMQYANQLFNLTGLGENAGQGIANLAGQVGGQIGGDLVGIGNAQAAGDIGQANALASGAAGIGSAFSGTANSLAGYSLYQNLLAAQSGQGGEFQVGSATIPTDPNYGGLTTPDPVVV